MLFNRIRIQKPKYSNFNLSHEKKLSCQMGNLIPIYLDEIVPGDRFRVKSEIMMRMSPMVAPVMHRVNVFVHYFFVPNRLLYDSWETFITGGREGTSAPTFPVMTLDNTTKSDHVPGTLADYLGLPLVDSGTTVTQDLDYSALPFRAYQMIFNEYYRDQTLKTPVAITGDSTVSGAEYTELHTLRSRAWEKDYFTSCLPWTQRGSDVNLPIDAEFSPEYSQYTRSYKSSDDSPTGAGTHVSDAGSVLEVPSGTDAYLKNLEDPQTVDTTSVTINDLRIAIRLQEWLEKNARGGYRYIEQTLHHFGIKSSDARLQRPEYLGGGRQPIVMSEVLQTTGEPSPSSFNALGTMGGHGISVGSTPSFKKSFEEHGYIMGIMSVLPRTAYTQGVHKHWLKHDKLDYYFPEFAHLGEQAVLNKEVYYDPDSASGWNDETFGYQSRFAEYKFKNSECAGQFRDDLDHWHLSRIFASAPTLNTAFVSASNVSQRIFADTDTAVDKLYCQIFHHIRALRPMPYWGTPRL